MMTASTLISHMVREVRLRSPPTKAVRVMRNAACGGRKGVKTRFALTAGKVADFPDSPKTANAQSSKRRVALDTPRVHPHRLRPRPPLEMAQDETGRTAKT